MTKNMGMTDRTLRIIIAAAVAILAFTGVVKGTLLYVLVAVAGIFVLTSAMGWCGIYALFGVKTCKTKPSA